jgi:hypothetical protein
MRKWVLFLLVLVLIAAVRVERSVAELQGRGPAPSKVLHLARTDSGNWAVWFLGWAGQIDQTLTQRPLQVVRQQIKRALP